MRAKRASDRIALAAAALVGARRGAPKAVTLPPELTPQNEAEAYAVQREVMRQLDATTGGWKVSMSDLQTGTSASIFAAHVLPSPANWAASEPLGIEPEIAFRMAHDLPPLPSGARYERDAVIAAIDSAYAAIEIVTSRFKTHDGAPPLDRLADSISNGGLILGPATRDWRRQDLSSLLLCLQIDGETVHEARGGHPLGDPLLPLVWLANHLGMHDRGLKAGEIVTTGSCAGLRYAAADSIACATFEGLGSARLVIV